MHFYICCRQTPKYPVHPVTDTDVKHTWSGNHDDVNASERCLKHLRLAGAHRESVTEQMDRSAGRDPPAAYEAQRTRSGRHVKATQHRCKARRPQAGEMAFQGHRGRWVSINQEGKRKSFSAEGTAVRDRPCRSRGRGCWAETQTEGGTRRRSWVAGGAGRKELQNPANHLAHRLSPQEEGASKRWHRAGRPPWSAETTGVASKLERRKWEEEEGKIKPSASGGAPCESNALSRCSSLPVSLSGVT